MRVGSAAKICVAVGRSTNAGVGVIGMFVNDD
jgi:hypothetical protein